MMGATALAEGLLLMFGTMYPTFATVDVVGKSPGMMPDGRGAPAVDDYTEVIAIAPVVRNKLIKTYSHPNEIGEATQSIRIIWGTPKYSNTLNQPHGVMRTVLGSVRSGWKENSSYLAYWRSKFSW